MRTYFKRKCIYLLISCIGSMGLISCDASTWAEILIPIINEIINPPGNYEASLQFSGNAEMEVYKYNASNNTYDRDSRQSTSVPSIATVQYNDSICQIQMNDLSVGGQSVNQVSFVTYFDKSTNTISPNEDYLTGGTCTLNGQAVEMDATCFSGKITNQTLQLNTIYFTIGDKLFKGTFQGSQTN